MTTRMTPAAILACALIAFSACHSNRDEVSLGESFQLAPGESQQVEQFTVRFDSITQD